jgi:hypothetical protein
MEIDEALVADALVASGILSETNADDPRNVASALAVAVERWCLEQVASDLVSVTRNGTDFSSVR